MGENFVLMVHDGNNTNSFEIFLFYYSIITAKDPLQEHAGVSWWLSLIMPGVGSKLIPTLHPSKLHFNIQIVLDHNSRQKTLNHGE